ncbi:hypothetical protein HGP16_24310 [Rhizobium sp. P40RR-XXII]|uniref:hypothetical protein n=1 Tax=unclassified Rhizobium TaxID=2613769 RepID=UPI0014565D99|nr:MULTISPECIES: hypothetical protein [unclassified Rhizobium]NLR87194.1 hypothetical protein [Rhizobium sp. P28RR-XV]NLS19664.1 hypothetical protein [Rhizobium sp. P40RR-XXII]
MSFRLHIWHAFVAGFAGGLFAFAVGREVWWAFARRPAGIVISEALSAIGLLRWIDTTLITGIAAVIAAFVSVRAVHQQIASERKMEEDRIVAQHAASRAVLPLVLSRICRYAKGTGTTLNIALKRCQGEALPRSVKLSEIPDPPNTAIDSLKEFIQFSNTADRRFVADLLSDIQVHSARLEGMILEREQGRPVLALNLEEYIFDAAEIYGRASALFDYARGENNSMPSTLYAEDIFPALSAFEIWDSSREVLIGRIARRHQADPARRDNH